MRPKVSDTQAQRKIQLTPTLLFMAEEQKRRRGAVEMGPTAATVAANVRRLRDDVRGWSTYELSGKLAKAGRPIGASAVAKIERGERQVTVDDLMALASALRVSPSALLLPLKDGPHETVDITGVGEIAADRAWDWLDGKPLTVEPGNYDVLLEHDLYSRPPRRRRSWNAIQGLIPEGAKDADVIQQLGAEDVDDDG